MSTAQATKNCITLKGSAQIIVEYLSKYRNTNNKRNNDAYKKARSKWRPAFIYLQN